jgi:hypothetical protein
MLRAFDVIVARPLGKIAVLRRFLGLSAIVGLFAIPGVAQASGAPCRVAAAFSDLQQQVPAIGHCLDDSARAGNGDVVQPTSGGLLVFRQSTATPAFTDGYHTWTIGPLGLQERLNSQTFSWETPASMGLALGVARAPASPVLKVLSTTIGAATGPLRFRVAGNGFQPGERATIGGTYTPLPSGPEPHACRTLPLGPVTVTADSAGNIAASIDVANPHTGVNYVLRATGEHSGPSNLALSIVSATC